MERELWMQLYALLIRFDRRWTNGFYRPSEILAVFLWAVVHDRPTCWACQRRNWGELAPDALPAQSTMCRRLRTVAVRQLLTEVEAAIGGDPRHWWLQRIDSKPLPVGVHSKDIDAKWGRAGCRFARGYKLHAVWGGGPLPSQWRVESMNVNDATVAREMLRELPGEGYVVGDKQYDTNHIHEAAYPYHQVVAAQQRPGKALGHRRHHRGRLRSLELTKRTFGRSLLRYRNQIERDFSQLTCFGAGLSPLPSWVRRPHRVRLWVQVKLLINAIRIQLNNPSHVIATA